MLLPYEIIYNQFNCLTGVRRSKEINGVRVIYHPCVTKDTLSYHAEY